VSGTPLPCDDAGIPGRAVRFDPMKPKLKQPGTKRLKLKCDTLLSTSAFKLICAATTGVGGLERAVRHLHGGGGGQQAGAYTPPLLGST
jgi:hypothetical protein